MRNEKNYATATVKVHPRVQKMLQAEKAKCRLPIMDIVEAAVKEYIQNRKKPS